MSAIQAELLQHLPFKRKQTLGGWLAFNAPCCVHKGESPDTRQRGGLILQGNGGFTYHCFNCGFKTHWQPGRLLSQKTKALFDWINIPSTRISELALDALKQFENIEQGKFVYPELTEKEMPEGTMPLTQALIEYPDSVRHLEYILDRGHDLEDCDWHYCPDPGYKDRIFIPFYHRKLLVGWTARKITDGRPKYLSESQSGYVFNVDQQDFKNRFVLVTEGPFDALAIGGVAIMTNLPNEQQIATIKSLGKLIVVVPDRDYTGMGIAKVAMEQEWLVAIPPWEDDVNDASDAVKKYGKLFTLKSIIDTATSNKVKIELMIKKYPKQKKSN